MGFAAAALSQARVQVVGRDGVLSAYADTPKAQRERAEFARRGVILSSDGQVLAQTVSAFEFRLDLSRVPESPGFFLELGEAVGIPVAELTAPTPPGRPGRTWRRTLSTEQAERVGEVRRQWDADGVSLARVTQRSYALGESASGVLGVLRPDGPIGGVEQAFDDDLAGKDGLSRGFYDRWGTFVLDPAARQEPRRQGVDVTLTIDSELQAAAGHAVRQAVESNRAARGCAIVLDPKTGDLLAVANWPSYDPAGSIAKGTDFNMATMGAYEPGSTFKVLTLAKGLDSGVVGLGDHTQCVGSMVVGKRRVHCPLHNGRRDHGDVDLERAIAKSCNVAAAQWALRIGRPGLVRFMESLGLFERTNLGLPGTPAGSYVREEYAHTLQAANFGFGQALSAVPVQLAAAYGLLANDGVMMSPRLVKRVGADERPVRSRGPIVSPEVARDVLRIMEAVVESDFGTGKSLRLPGYRLAGKTGTAQKIGTAEGAYVSNFVGFVPAESPRAVVLVMIDSPSAGQYFGGAVAGPVFLEVAKAVVRRFAIPPSTARSSASPAGGGSLTP